MIASGAAFSTAPAAAHQSHHKGESLYRCLGDLQWEPAVGLRLNAGAAWQRIPPER